MLQSLLNKLLCMCCCFWPGKLSFLTRQYCTLQYYCFWVYFNWLLICWPWLLITCCDDHLFVPPPPPPPLYFTPLSSRIIFLRWICTIAIIFIPSLYPFSVLYCDRYALSLLPSFLPSFHKNFLPPSTSPTSPNSIPFLWYICFFCSVFTPISQSNIQVTEYRVN